MLSFTGKTALVTGAGSGIGRATATMLAALGANVVANDIDAAALQETIEGIASGRGDFLLHVADVADAQACAGLAKAAAERFGRLDFLVHAAGVYSKPVRVGEMSDTAWRSLLRINLDGTFNVCRSVLPYLSDDSSIVTLASVAAHRGSHSHAEYAASKGAVVSFTRSLALELAPRTRVNAVSPGVIDTPMTSAMRLTQRGADLLKETPLRRHGTAEEIAGPIVFLCSSLSAYMTGEVLHVNGGMYLG